MTSLKERVVLFAAGLMASRSILDEDIPGNPPGNVDASACEGTLSLTAFLWELVLLDIKFSLSLACGVVS
ncbi:hypothetical protein WICPIJ_007361 [Wickerhamomyces pijperi]|uniref:Uncharacterized protein n=1 Tax=Wickerhamomyces pijperi TaxID=599730 RepID=A0A9P8Q034_WICPI|nr:hypothetical protein WICPIJ_007361 [Wickerhamomyces pijperi]